MKITNKIYFKIFYKCKILKFKILNFYLNYN